MAPEIIAVILCGGESKRMGKPKASLHYHQLPQYEHLLNICNNSASVVLYLISIELES